MSSLAVLIDADNMPAEHAPEVMRRARLWGDVSIVRLFGDFSGNRLADWCELAHNNGYETILQLNGGKGKNSTDIALTIHAMDLLHDGAVDCFCLASNDRDFLPLAARLRGAGKRVYAVCTKLDQRMTMSFTAVIALAPTPRLAVQTAGPSKPISKPVPPQAKAPISSQTPIVSAFLAVSGDQAVLTLAQAGLLLRRHAPLLFKGVSKNGGVRKMFKESGQFEELGSGSALRIRLKRA